MSLVEKLIGLAGKDRHYTEECLHDISPSTIPMVPGQLKEVREIIDDTIWDTFRPVNGSNFSYFSPRDGAKMSDTNMISGYIPFSKRFKVTGVSAEIVPLYARIISREAHKDLQRIADGVIELVINNKIYQKIPVSMILRSSVLASDPDPKMPSICSYCSAPIVNPGSLRCDYCGAVYLHPVSESKKEKNQSPPKFSFKNGFIITSGTPFSENAYWPEPPSGENDLGMRLYLHGQRERTVY